MDALKIAGLPRRFWLWGEAVKACGLQVVSEGLS
jgi:hypothetical protein